MKASLFVLPVLLFSIAGCSMFSRKEPAEPAKAEMTKEQKMEGGHMSGQAKVLGKEDSIADFVQTQAEKDQQNRAEKIVNHLSESKEMAAAAVSTVNKEAHTVAGYKLPKDEYRCKKGDANDRKKAQQPVL